jgi:hypothetical protein
MSRGKSKNHTQFEQVLNILASNPESRDTGRVVSVSELTWLLSDKVCMNRMSVYMWEIKSRGIVIKPIRDGRKVTAYQIINMQAANDYLVSRGHSVPTSSEVQTEEVLTEDTEEMVEELIHE